MTMTTIYLAPESICTESAASPFKAAIGLDQGVTGIILVGVFPLDQTCTVP